MFEVRRDQTQLNSFRFILRLYTLYGFIFYLFISGTRIIRRVRSFFSSDRYLRISLDWPVTFGKRVRFAYEISNLWIMLPFILFTFNFTFNTFTTFRCYHSFTSFTYYFTLVTSPYTCMYKLTESKSYHIFYYFYTYK